MIVLALLSGSTRHDRHNLVLSAQASDPGCSEPGLLTMTMTIFTMIANLLIPSMTCYTLCTYSHGEAVTGLADNRHGHSQQHVRVISELYWSMCE